MRRFQMIRADLVRWTRGIRLFSSGGKRLLILMVALAGLWSYGRINALQRAAAEDSVKRLTTLSQDLHRALDGISEFETLRQGRMSEHQQHAKAVTHDPTDSLDALVPVDLLERLRP